MKKLMTIFALALATTLIVPSCSSDGDFEEVVENSDLDQSYTTDSRDSATDKPGSN